ncbi:MAG: carboxypeptidase M32 [Planctomycetota bacterium]|nr:MAG: carboxypeptidase M32 [Planctomycetota bacterium]
MMENYKNLENHFARITKVGCLFEILHWDMAVMMPPGSGKSRGEELAELQVILHELSIDPQIKEWLEGAKTEELDPWQKANLREMERIYIHATAVPTTLVEEAAKAGSACELCWREARGRDDFKALEPYLQKVVDLAREISLVKGEALGMKPYDALLDQFEPGMTMEEIDCLFGEIEGYLPDLINEVIEFQASQSPPLALDGPFPPEKQKKLALEVIKAIGFDFQRGRVDESHHPFCGGTPQDVRITSRYNEQDLLSGLMSIFHETGHALYEFGLPVKWQYQPVGRARSLGIHESQSLLMEMQVCHSQEFFNFFTPLAMKILEKTGPAWNADNLYKVASKVQRSLIRVDADEVTYPAHVILRYKLEKALMNDELKVKDLPSAWNEEMQKLVGITPTNNKDGCMQDIHWMDGTFGYFPTYTLGAMNAAQIFQACQKDIPQVLTEVAKGNFKPLVEWLREKIHSKGSFLTTKELMTEATGKPLDGSIFQNHLRRRYLGGKN